MELIAKLVTTCVTVWRTWHCLSSVEFGLIYRAWCCWERLELFIVLVVVSVGVVVSTEPILMVPLFAELIGVDVCRCQRHHLQRPSLPKAWL